MLLPRSLGRAAALLLALSALFVVITVAAASTSENEAAVPFAAAAPAAAAAAPSSSASSSVEPLDPTSAAIVAAAAAVDAATVDALLRTRASVSSSPKDSKREGASPEVADADAADASGPLPAPSSSSLAAGEESTLARESQEAYRSYKGLVPGSRLARLAPLGAFPGSPPARAESATPPLGGRATLTGPGEATSALLASLPPPVAAPAPSSYWRGKGRNKPPSPAPSSAPSPKGDANSGSKRLWKVVVDASATKQTFEGWGTSLAWWALVVGSFTESVRNKVVDLMFDAGKGLGLEVVR